MGWSICGPKNHVHLDCRFGLKRAASLANHGLRVALGTKRYRSINPEGNRSGGGVPVEVRPGQWGRRYVVARPLCHTPRRAAQG
jgi:hypothetical protein